MASKKELWSGLRDMLEQDAVWRKAVFAQVDVLAMCRTVEWYAQLVGRMDKELPHNGALPVLRGHVTAWQDITPVLCDLCNPALEVYHWVDLKNITGAPLHEMVQAGVCIEELIAGSLLEKAEEVRLVSVTATQERALNTKLRRVEELWANAYFEVQDFKPAIYKSCYVLGPVDDISAILQDTQTSIATILASRYVARIHDKVEEWERKLRRCADCVDAWVLCQTRWCYLDTVFQAPDIGTKLPQEDKWFQHVDKRWREAMKKVKEDPLALKVGTAPGLLEMFQSSNEKLEEVTRNLDAYLEQKRAAFPRFCFVCDQDLINILSKAKTPSAVLPYVPSMFSGINLLEIGAEGEDNENEVLAVRSAEGERMAIEKPFKASHEVQRWLNQTEGQMRASVARDMKRAVKVYAEEDSGDFPVEGCNAGLLAMCMCVAMQVHWAQEIQAAFLKHEKPDRVIKSLKNLLEARGADLGTMVEHSQRELPVLTRRSVASAVVLAVNSRDMLQSFIEERVTQISAFAWRAHLRYEWGQDEALTVAQGTASFKFGHEYTGVGTRLVVTPLTQRATLSVCTAAKMSMGAVLMGSPGSGKTETMLHLAQCLGVPCVVYSSACGCSLRSLSCIVSGTAQVGSWCILESLSNAPKSMLAVVASQIQQVRSAILQQDLKLVLDGRDITVKPSALVLSGLTASGTGAAWRGLPEPLRALFRPVAMMAPEVEHIVHVTLLAHGTMEAKLLAHKLCTIAKLVGEAVPGGVAGLGAVGMLPRLQCLLDSVRNRTANPHRVGGHEDMQLLHGLVKSYATGFPPDQERLFHQLVEDVAPGLLSATPPSRGGSELDRELQLLLDTKSLCADRAVIGKVMQLHHTLGVRPGVALVGEAGSGKTVSRTSLATVLEKLYKAQQVHASVVGHPVTVHQVHPRAVGSEATPRGDALFGGHDAVSGEWEPGVAEVMLREVAKDTSEGERWVVFDSRLDTAWMEALHGALDVARTVCLGTGERINVPDTVRLLFETDTLADAAPGSIARLGLVHYPQPDRPSTWLLRQYIGNSDRNSRLPQGISEAARKEMEAWMERYLDGVLDVAHELGKQHGGDAAWWRAQRVRGMLDTFSMVCRGGDDTPVLWGSMNDESQKALVRLCVVHAFTWGVGGTLPPAAYQAPCPQCFTLQLVYTVCWAGIRCSSAPSSRG